MNLIYFVLAGAVLYILLHAFNLVLKALIRRNAIKSKVLRVFPLVEFGAWLAFSFWGFRLIFGDLRYYDQLIAFAGILLIVGIAWYVFRDFFAGMILKIGYGLHAGQHIRTDTFEGRILHLGNRYVELQQASGARIFVPYSRLAGAGLGVYDDREISQLHHLVIELPDHIDPVRLRRFVRHEMMNMPWVVGQKPEIIINADTARNIEIKFRIIRQEHALIVEEKLRAAIFSCFGSP